MSKVAKNGIETQPIYPSATDRGFDGGIIPWVWLALAIGAGAVGLSTNTSFVLNYPVEAFSVVVLAAAGSSLRVTAAAFPKTFTVSMAPMVLSILYSTAGVAWVIYGLWVFGALVASVIRHRSVGQLGLGALLIGFSGAALVAVRLYYPPEWELALPWLSPLAVPIFLSVLASFLIATVFGGVGLLLQSREAASRLASGVGWSRIFGLALAEAVGAVAAHELSHSFWGSAFIDTEAGLFQASVAAATLTLIVTALLIIGRRQTRLKGRERSLTASVNEMPWPTSPSIEEQAVDHLRHGFSGFNVEVVAANAGPERSDGRTISSGKIMSETDSFQILIRRRPFGRPFVAGDSEYLEAISTLAMESVAARREVERIRTIQNMDTMTGLPNYRALRSSLMELQEDSAPGTRTCLLFLQVQNLHEINQDFSPEIGDEVLRAIAGRIERLVGTLPAASAYRIAGDEFGILLTNLHSRREADRVSVEIDDEVSLPVDSSGGLVALSISQTTAFADDGDPESIGALVAQADEQMYRGRRKYINVPGAITFDEPTGEIELPQSGPTAALIQALREDRLRQVYQPIIDREEGRIVALEAAVRYTDPVFGALPPQFLVSEARRLGLRSKLAAQVLEHSVGDMERFRVVAPELKTLQVNISPAQLVDLEFTQAYERIRKEHPDLRIVLELDANEVRVAPAETAQRAGDYARRHNVLLALDEMGTGYSEFAALIQYPVVAMVLGESVLDSLSQPWAHDVASNHLRFVPDGVRLIAKGVSTEEEVQLLEDLAIRYAQGPFYGNPVSASEFVVRLTTLGLELS